MLFYLLLMGATLEVKGLGKKDEENLLSFKRKDTKQHLVCSFV